MPCLFYMPLFLLHLQGKAASAAEKGLFQCQSALNAQKNTFLAFFPQGMEGAGFAERYCLLGMICVHLAGRRGFFAMQTRFFPFGPNAYG